MHKDRDFRLYIAVINYDKYIRKYIASNIPAVHRDLKIHLLDEIYNLKRQLLEAQYNKGNIRVKYIVELLVTISMLDIILTDISELCPSIKKHLNVAIEQLTRIKNMTYAWRKNPEPDEKTNN